MKHSKERVAHELRMRLGEILSQRVSDPRLEFVTVSEVKPSPDLSVARVFWRTLGDASAAGAALEKATPFIRRCLAKEVQMRRVPELTFILDETLERADRLETIFRELRPDDADDADDSDREAGARPPGEEPA